MSACPDTADGWHVWQLEVAPHRITFDSLEVGEVRALPTVVTCRICGAVQ